MAEDAGLPPAEVRFALERAVELQPDFDDALFRLALAEKVAGDTDAALKHLRGMRDVIPARRFAYWAAMSDALDQLGQRSEAKTAADNAKRWARTDQQRSAAERLAYAAETDLGVRFSRDRDGNLQLETARAPHSMPDWNPFIEATDHVRRIQGSLREIECGENATVFIVATSNSLPELRLPDPSHVQMQNAPAEFTCGSQDEAQVRAVYAETGPSTGLLRGLEFR